MKQTDRQRRKRYRCRDRKWKKIFEDETFKDKKDIHKVKKRNRERHREKEKGESER